MTLDRHIERNAGLVSALRHSVYRLTARFLTQSCRRSETLFNLLYHWSGDSRTPSPLFAHDIEDEVKIESVVRELRERGISKWPGLFKDEHFLQMARPFIMGVKQDAASAFRGCAEDAKDIYDSMNQRYFFSLHPQARVFYPARAPVKNYPEPVKRILQSVILAEVAHRYLGSVGLFGVNGEVLSPATRDQAWHMDVLGDQLKAIVLCSDVGDNDGAPRYRTETHRARYPDVWRLRHRALAGDHRNAIIVPDEIAERVGVETVLGTGEAGDVIFLDTHGVHSGTRTHEKLRLTLTAYYQLANTRRNRLVKMFETDLPPEGWD